MNAMSSITSDWNIYRTRFLIKARQLDTPLIFTDPLGREHRGGKGDYLVESSDGLQRIAPREIFEDIYVPMGSAGDSRPSPFVPELDFHSQAPVRESHPVRSQPLTSHPPSQSRQSVQGRPSFPQPRQAQPQSVQQHEVEQVKSQHQEVAQQEVEQQKAEHPDSQSRQIQHHPQPQHQQLRQSYRLQQQQQVYEPQPSQPSPDPQLSPRRSAVNRTFVA
jgi:hypothetical protein